MKTVKITIYLIVFVIVYIYIKSFISRPSNSFKIRLKKSHTFTQFQVEEPFYEIPGNRRFITSYKWFRSKLRHHVFKDLGEEDRPRYTDMMPICKLDTQMLGPILVNKTKLKLKWVEEKYPEIRGGFYAPTNCRPRHKVAILVPYRNRESNLISFLNHMHAFLKTQHLEYRIFVIEQFGTKKFNKGSLYNVGFLESQRFGSWHCMIFHDVDLLPLDERILYSCPRAPTHMSPAVESNAYKLHYPKLFGGVTSLTVAQFETVNGYSNMYWDWGAEDDDMFKRLQAKRFPLLRYNQSIARYAALPHKRSRRNPLRHYILSYAKRRFKKEGLCTVRYILVNATKRQLFTHILVDVNPYKLKV